MIVLMILILITTRCNRIDFIILIRKERAFEDKRNLVIKRETTFEDLIRSFDIMI